MFRDFDNKSTRQSTIRDTYRAMHEGQTPQFARTHKKNSQQASAQKPRLRIEDIFHLLERITDDSDPDTDLPQDVHAYQTGEALRLEYLAADNKSLKPRISIRKLFSDAEWKSLPLDYQKLFEKKNLKEFYPEIEDWSWLPMIGFIHDLGKVLMLPEWGALPQWATVGDTFPVDAPFSKANVFYDEGFYKKNPGLGHRAHKGGQLFGRYEKKCGFDRVDMSFGHDEYLYQVLKRNHHQLPDEALYIIRYHSFYSWHSPRNGPRGYEELASEKDWSLLPLLKAFQKSDLYSKKGNIPNRDELREYYYGLIRKFIPGRAESEYSERLRAAPLMW